MLTGSRRQGNVSRGCRLPEEEEEHLALTVSPLLSRFGQPPAGQHGLQTQENRPQRNEMAPGASSPEKQDKGHLVGKVPLAAGSMLCVQ